MWSMSVHFQKGLRRLKMNKQATGVIECNTDAFKIKQLTDEVCKLHSVIEQIHDLVPKWTSIKNPPSETCYAWVASGSDKELCQFYICPEYGDGFWQDTDGDDVKLSGDCMYSIINEPELPEVENE